MSKQFWGVIVIIILVFVGIFAFSSHKSTSSGGSNSGTPSHHVEGDDQDHVTLVEYGDYECPYCGEYFPTVKQVETEFNNQIQFQFRNFPLVSIHQNAFAGARAAEAASLQGQFWQMHDLLYEEQDSWVSATDPTTYFDSFAKQLGLNISKFETDYASGQVNNTINADIAAGNKLNIQGTPTFFVDGKQVTIADSVASFEQVIKQAIAKQAPTNAGATSQTTGTSSAQ
jgi:protein-disulfide isomerase